MGRLITAVALLVSMLGVPTAQPHHAAPRTVPPTAATPLRIVTLGDSIMCGPGWDCVNQPDRSTYGPRGELDRLLTWAHVPHVIIDESIPGSRVDSFLGTAADIIRRDQPDVVILALGTNDAQNDNAYWNFYGGEARYRKLVDFMVAAKPDLKVMPTLIQTSNTWFGSRETDINKWITWAATGENAPVGTPDQPPFVSFVSWQFLTGDTLGADGIHPKDSWAIDQHGWLMYRGVASWLAQTTP